MLTPREKSPVAEKILLRRGSNPTLHQAGQQAQHAIQGSSRFFFSFLLSYSLLRVNSLAASEEIIYKHM